MVSRLPSPSRPNVDVLIIAGEHSGDQHAARIVNDLDPSLNVCAIGGQSLEDAGAQLLYDLTKSSVVGLYDVLKNFSYYKKIFNQTFDWIAEHKPKVVMFVDYPGFNLRMAEKLFTAKLARKGGGSITLAYYVSPQIWAWKAKRRFKMAKWLDSLAVIFPFEVDCYKDTDLPVHFVGHPFACQDYANKLSFSSDAPILLLPGSRKAAVRRILPVMIQAFQFYLSKNPGAKASIIYPSESIKSIAENALSCHHSAIDSIELISNAQNVSGSAVLGSSGTMSLNFALAGIPGAILYKAHPLTYILGRMLVDIDRLGIANILMDEFVYPEYLQGKATAKALAEELNQCTSNSSRREAIAQTAENLKSILAQPAAHSPASWLSSLVSSDPSSLPQTTEAF